jgi:hypothetical protein
MKNSITIFVALTVFISCQKESTTFTENIPSNNNVGAVDISLQDYFDRFEAEGQARGYDIDLSATNITGSIEEIDEDYVAGQCSYGPNHPSEIVIDAEFWNVASDLLKEMVVFHELGHCYLYRGHEEGVFSNGTCQSIMRSGVEGCLDNYNVQTREYYVNELFEGTD